MSLRQLNAAREARDAARGKFDAQLAQVRGDPHAGSIKERVVERLSEDARNALQQTLDVAAESKGVIAATVAALALWFLRHPIIAWIEQLLGDETETPEETEIDD